MKNYRIDLDGIYSADELHELIAKNLPLPDYYGGTLDALYDVFSEVNEDWEIEWTSMDLAEAVMGKYIRSLEKMCRRVTQENPHLVMRFLR